MNFKDDMNRINVIYGPQDHHGYAVKKTAKSLFMIASLAYNDSLHINDKQTNIQKKQNYYGKNGNNDGKAVCGSQEQT